MARNKKNIADDGDGCISRRSRRPVRKRTSRVDEGIRKRRCPVKRRSPRSTDEKYQFQIYDEGGGVYTADMKNLVTGTAEALRNVGREIFASWEEFILDSLEKYKKLVKSLSEEVLSQDFLKTL